MTRSPAYPLHVEGATFINNKLVVNNVGILTSNPQYPLHIEGAAYINNKLVVNNVGILTSNPQYPLHVEGSAYVNGTIMTTSYLETIGADYAEYMKKEEETISIYPGDIIGITRNGTVTTMWQDAHSFAIASTSPGNIGGSPIDKDKYHLYEMIAFCGRVPVNLDIQARPGDYIVPVLELSTGKIRAKAIAQSQLTFQDYMMSVGKVISVLSDTQVEVIVKLP